MKQKKYFLSRWFEKLTMHPIGFFLLVFVGITAFCVLVFVRVTDLFEILSEFFKF